MTKCKEEKTKSELHKNAMSYSDHILEEAHYETTAIWPDTFHL